MVQAPRALAERRLLFPITITISYYYLLLLLVLLLLVLLLLVINDCIFYSTFSFYIYIL